METQATKTAEHPVARKIGGVSLAIGIGMMVLGVIALADTFAVAVVSVILLGALLIATLAASVAALDAIENGTVIEDATVRAITTDLAQKALVDNGTTAVLDALADQGIDTDTPGIEGITRGIIESIVSSDAFVNVVHSQTKSIREQMVAALNGEGSGAISVSLDFSDQVNALIVDANALFGELSLRRDAITELIANISSVSRQLTGLVQDNQAQMAPTLEKLNLVTANLQANKENIAGALDGLGPYISALGESVASGPFFNAYVSNILPAPWWKAVVDSQVAPDLLPEDLQDVIPDEPPTIKRDGE